MSNANALNLTITPTGAFNQYDEGTFTPTISGSTVAGVGVYTTQLGFYQRIGNLIAFSGTVVWTAHTGTGNILLTALPFTSTATAGYVSLVNVAIQSVIYPAATVDTVGTIAASATSAALVATRSNNTTLAIVMDVSGTVTFSGFYLTQ